MSEVICKLELPFYVHMGKERLSLSMNKVQHLHWTKKRKLKALYQSILRAQIPKDAIRERVSLELVIHAPDRVRRDRSNMLSIHEKFVCDALVDHGVLEDDNDKFIESTTYRTGEIDKQNPRVDLFIRRAI